MNAAINIDHKDILIWIQNIALCVYIAAILDI